MPVDVIIASSDRSAFGALKAFRSVGLYVPEDVKMISFDDTLYSELATPALTSLKGASTLKRLLCPSMMCASYDHLASEVRALDDAGVDSSSAG